MVITWFLFEIQKMFSPVADIHPELRHSCWQELDWRGEDSFNNLEWRGFLCWGLRHNAPTLTLQWEHLRDFNSFVRRGFQIFPPTTNPHNEYENLYGIPQSIWLLYWLCERKKKHCFSQKKFSFFFLCLTWIKVQWFYLLTDWECLWCLTVDNRNIFFLFHKINKRSIIYQKCTSPYWQTLKRAAKWSCSWKAEIRTSFSGNSLEKLSWTCLR